MADQTKDQAQSTMLSAIDFFKEIEKLLCLSATQLSDLCRIPRPKMYYWMGTSVSELPENWNHLGVTFCPCGSVHLPAAKFVFAMSEHVLAGHDPVTARGMVLKNGSTRADWNKNYEPEWQKAIRSRLVFRNVEAARMMSHFCSDLPVSKYFLDFWAGEKYLQKFVTLDKETTLEVMDIYQMYAAYVLAFKVNEAGAKDSRKRNDIAKDFFWEANKCAERQYMRDNGIKELAFIELDSPLLQPQNIIATTEEISPKKILRDFLRNSFPEFITTDAVQAGSGLGEIALDLLETMVQKGIVEEKRISSGFIYRLSTSHFNR
jgi:hypothetical protein